MQRPIAPQPNELELEQLSEGYARDYEYQITEAVWRALLETFGDVNPMHLDASYAQAAGFQGPVMHGAIVNGFVSHFVGMVLPGRRALLLSADVRYLEASYLNDILKIRGEVSQRNEALGVVVLAVTVENLTRQRVVARGRVQAKVLRDS